MSTLVTRPARAEELAGLWPAVRAHRVFDDEDAFRAFADDCPWCVRLDERGDAAVVEPWRETQPVLAVRGLWAPDRRTGAWIAALCDVAAERGYRELMSPLVPMGRTGPWIDGGMSILEVLVGLQGAPASVRGPAEVPGVSIEPGELADLERIVAIDAASFSPFWRFSAGDLQRAWRGARVSVARRDGRVLGYTLCTVGRGAGVLVRLAVDPEARGHGIGTALLVDAARYVHRAGAITLTLCTQESNEASRALYASVGLAEVEERYALAAIRVMEG